MKFQIQKHHEHCVTYHINNETGYKPSAPGPLQKLLENTPGVENAMVTARYDFLIIKGTMFSWDYVHCGVQEVLAKHFACSIEEVK